MVSHFHIEWVCVFLCPLFFITIIAALKNSGHTNKLQYKTANKKIKDQSHNNHVAQPSFQQQVATNISKKLFSIID